MNKRKSLSNSLRPVYTGTGIRPIFLLIPRRPAFSFVRMSSYRLLITKR